MMRRLYTVTGWKDIAQKGTFESYKKMIGLDDSGSAELLLVSISGEQHYMMVDEEGRHKRLPPNERASRIYADSWPHMRPIPIVGPVVVVPRGDIV